MKLVTRKELSKSQKGQALLITLLIMVVGLTVGLAVVSRSITSVKISTQEEESQRAFYAAEAGLEEALLTGSEATNISIGDAEYTVKIDKGDDYTRFVFPGTVGKDETQTLWLVKFNDDGSIKDGVGYGTNSNPGNLIDICWNNASPKPAMEVMIIYQRKGGNREYRLARGAYDPQNSRINGTNGNNFTYVNDQDGENCKSGGDPKFKFRQRINFTGSDFNINLAAWRIIALRLRPIYSGTKIAVQTAGGASFRIPPQGKTIASTGKSGTAQRKVKVFRSYPSLPPIFDYAMYSGADIAK